MWNHSGSLGYAGRDAGAPTHMMAEPGPLLRPLHLTVSALAQFVEGAKYEGRLAPQDAISAHVFMQPNARFFANGPSMVVALIANEPETLPRPLPDGLHCFDRWGNPADTPKEATRGISYLVATGVQAQAGLREALQPAPDGAKGRWRLVTLTIVPRADALTEEQMKPAGELLEQWERGVGTGDILSLRDTLMPKPFCVLFAMPTGEVLAETSYFTTMLHAMVVYNMKKSAMTITRMAGAGTVVTALGLWEVDSPFTGPMKLAITATLVRDGDAWKLMTLSCGPQLPQPAPQQKPAEKQPEPSRTGPPSAQAQQPSPESAPSPAHGGITLVALAVGGIMVFVLLVIGIRRMRRR